MEGMFRGLSKAALGVATMAFGDMVTRFSGLSRQKPGYGGKKSIITMPASRMGSRNNDPDYRNRGLQLDSRECTRRRRQAERLQAKRQ
jgi:hypothetical protein